MGGGSEGYRCVSRNYARHQRSRAATFSSGFRTALVGGALRHGGPASARLLLFVVCLKKNAFIVEPSYVPQSSLSQAFSI